jgi:predicted ATP-grasp superfamily ATP-dependent carboligase
MTAEWVIAGSAAITLIGAVLAALWKFSTSVDRLVVAVERIEKSLEKSDEMLDDHSVRITKLESWRENASNS